MAVTVSNVQSNHRGIACNVLGDGATTTFTVPHGRFNRTGTATAFCVFNHTVLDSRSGRGGFRAPTDGTVIASTASVSGAVFNVTTGSAIGNGVLAHVVALHDGEAD